MANRFNPGCKCCPDQETCLIFEDDFDPDVIEPDWDQRAGTWTIPDPPLGQLASSDDNALIVAMPGNSAPRKFEGVISSTAELSTAGIVVAYLDDDNYIYIKVKFPAAETAPSAGDGTPGTVTVIHRSGGVETAAQTETTGPTPGLAPANITFTVCTIEATSGYLPVVQIATDYFDDVHACVPTLPGSGFGFRTDNMLSGEFNATGIGFAISHNWRADSAIAKQKFDLGVFTGLTDCECICQCQNCAESAPPPELTVDISSFSGSTSGVCDLPTDDCSDFSGSYVLECTPPEAAAYQGNVFIGTCNWITTFVLGGGADPISSWEMKVSLAGFAVQDQAGQWVFDSYRLHFYLTCQYDWDGFSYTSSATAIQGTRILGTTKPAMFSLDMSYQPAELSVNLCPTVGAIRVQSVAVEGCPA